MKIPLTTLFLFHFFLGTARAQVNDGESSACQESVTALIESPIASSLLDLTPEQSANDPCPEEFQTLLNQVMESCEDGENTQSLFAAPFPYSEFFLFAFLSRETLPWSSCDYGYNVSACEQAFAAMAAGALPCFDGDFALTPEDVAADPCPVHCQEAFDLVKSSCQVGDTASAAIGEDGTAPTIYGEALLWYTQLAFPREQCDVGFVPDDDCITKIVELEQIVKGFHDEVQCTYDEEIICSPECMQSLDEVQAVYSTPEAKYVNSVFASVPFQGKASLEERGMHPQPQSLEFQGMSNACWDYAFKDANVSAIDDAADEPEDMDDPKDMGSDAPANDGEPMEKEPNSESSAPVKATTQYIVFFAIFIIIFSSK